MNNRHEEMRPLAGDWEARSRPGWPHDKTPVWKRFTLVVPANPHTPVGPPGEMFECVEDGHLTGYLWVDFVLAWAKPGARGFSGGPAPRRVTAGE